MDLRVHGIRLICQPLAAPDRSSNWNPPSKLDETNKAILHLFLAHLALLTVHLSFNF
jgi:hypothetical protein